MGIEHFCQRCCHEGDPRGESRQACTHASSHVDKLVAQLHTSVPHTKPRQYIARNRFHTGKRSMRTVDNMVMWVLEAENGLADDEKRSLQYGCQTTNFRVKTVGRPGCVCQHIGGIGLPSAFLRGWSASLGNLTSSLPAVITTLLRGSFGDSVRNKMLENRLVERMGVPYKTSTGKKDYRRRICEEWFPPQG